MNNLNFTINVTTNDLIYVGLFENGRVRGFRNLRINDAYNFLKTVRVVHRLKYFVLLLRRDRPITAEKAPLKFMFQLGIKIPIRLSYFHKNLVF
jgi:hypothetical protein